MIRPHYPSARIYRGHGSFRLERPPTGTAFWNGRRWEASILRSWRNPGGGLETEVYARVFGSTSLECEVRAEGLCELMLEQEEREAQREDCCRRCGQAHAGMNTICASCDAAADRDAEKILG